MPRKPNYGFDKRRKEQERKAKKDAKLRDRQQRREQEAAESALPPDAETGDTQSSPPLPPTDES